MWHDFALLSGDDSLFYLAFSVSFCEFSSASFADLPGVDSRNATGLPNSFSAACPMLGYFTDIAAAPFCKKRPV
jgi:hypothetical protein